MRFADVIKDGKSLASFAGRDEQIAHKGLCPCYGSVNKDWEVACQEAVFAQLEVHTANPCLVLCV